MSHLKDEKRTFENIHLMNCRILRKCASKYQRTKTEALHPKLNLRQGEDFVNLSTIKHPS